MRIEDYALIGNRTTAALVGRTGSIDWLGFPRFDSPAFFAALVGTPDNGRWLIAPKAEGARVKRRYREGTLILETEFETPQGAVLLTDCMHRRSNAGDVFREVRGLRGSVSMHMDLCFRFDYGQIVPWVARLPGGRLKAQAGPDQLILSTPAPIHGEGLRTVADFDVREGEATPFTLTWCESWRAAPDSPDPKQTVQAIEREWREWSSRCSVRGQYAEAVLRSLITLRALTDSDTGGIVASPTTSLPELIGGSRNWDYRYCWLRDSTFMLFALMESGYHDEARAWREWLMRAIGGSPGKMQIMYGLAGERRLGEYELEHLGGYEDSRPVRVGNSASNQLQLDVYGEILDSLYQARRSGLVEGDGIWNLELALARRLQQMWREPDDGIWEVRGGRRQFTCSKVLVWTAFDRIVRTMEEFGAPGPLDEMRRTREEVRREVEANGFDPQLNSFVQSFGEKELDASALLIPQVGFLPPADPRVAGTVAALEKNLMREGFLQRYRNDAGVDGIAGREGVFLACSFWLADVYVLQGRRDEARKLFEKLLALRNDVGLLSEEYDPDRRQLLGNFPLGLTHVALINTALNLTRERKPAEHRGM